MGGSSQGDPLRLSTGQGPGLLDLAVFVQRPALRQRADLFNPEGNAVQLDGEPVCGWSVCRLDALPGVLALCPKGLRSHCKRTWISFANVASTPPALRLQPWSTPRSSVRAAADSWMWPSTGIASRRRKRRTSLRLSG